MTEAFVLEMPTAESALDIHYVILEAEGKLQGTESSKHLEGDGGSGNKLHQNEQVGTGLSQAGLSGDALVDLKVLDQKSQDRLYLVTMREGGDLGEGLAPREESNGDRKSCSALAEVSRDSSCEQGKVELLEITQDSSAEEGKLELVESTDKFAPTGHGGEGINSAFENPSYDHANEVQETLGKMKLLESTEDSSAGKGTVEPDETTEELATAGYGAEGTNSVFENLSYDHPNEGQETLGIIRLFHKEDIESCLTCGGDELLSEKPTVGKKGKEDSSLIEASEPVFGPHVDGSASRNIEDAAFVPFETVVQTPLEVGFVEEEESLLQWSPTRKFGQHIQNLPAKVDENSPKLDGKLITTCRGEKCASDYNVIEAHEDNGGLLGEMRPFVAEDSSLSEGLLPIRDRSPILEQSSHSCQNYVGSAGSDLEQEMGGGNISWNEVKIDDTVLVSESQEEVGVARRENFKFETGSDPQGIRSIPLRENSPNLTVAASEKILVDAEISDNKHSQGHVFDTIAGNAIEVGGISEYEEQTSRIDHFHQQSIIQDGEDGAVIRILEPSVSKSWRWVSSSIEVDEIRDSQLCYPEEKVLASELHGRTEMGAFSSDLDLSQAGNGCAGSDEQGWKGTNYDKDGDSSMESMGDSDSKPFEIASHVILEEVQDSGSEDLPSFPVHIQPPLQQRKKRIDLDHQFLREIVKIQHDREQYERQVQAHQSSGNQAHRDLNAECFQEHNGNFQIGRKQSRRDSEKVDTQKSNMTQIATHPSKPVKELPSHAASNKKSTPHGKTGHSPQARGPANDNINQGYLALSEEESYLEGNQYGKIQRKHHKPMHNYRPPSVRDNFSSIVNKMDNTSDFDIPLHHSADLIPKNIQENSVTSTSDSYFPSVGSFKAAESGTLTVVRSDTGERYVHYVEPKTHQSTSEPIGIKVTFDTEKQQRRIEFSDSANLMHSRRWQKPTEYTSPNARRISDRQVVNSPVRSFDHSFSSQGNGHSLLFDVSKSIQPLGHVENGFARCHISPQGFGVTPFSVQSKVTCADSSSICVNGVGGFTQEVDTNKLAQHTFSEASVPTQPFNPFKTSSAKKLPKSYGDRSQLFEQADAANRMQHVIHLAPDSCPTYFEVTPPQNLPSNASQKRKLAEQTGSGPMLQHSSSLEPPTPTYVKATISEMPPYSISKESSTEEADGGPATLHTHHFGSLFPSTFKSISTDKFPAHVTGNVKSGEWIEGGPILQQVPLQTLGKMESPSQFNGTLAGMLSSSADRKIKSTTGVDRTKEKRQSRKKDRNKDHMPFSDTLLGEMQSLQISQLNETARGVKESNIHSFPQSTTFDEAKPQEKHFNIGSEKFHDITRSSVQVQQPQLSSLSVEKSTVQSVRLSGKWADIVDDSPEAYEGFGSNSQWNIETGVVQVPPRLTESTTKFRGLSSSEYSRSVISDTDELLSKNMTGKGFRMQERDNDAQHKVKIPQENVRNKLGPSINEISPRKSVWERLGPLNCTSDSILGPSPKGLEEKGELSMGLSGFSFGTPSIMNSRKYSKTPVNVASGLHGFSPASEGQQMFSLLQNDKGGITMGANGDEELSEVAVQAYKDSKQKRNKRELYVPRRGFPGF